MELEKRLKVIGTVILAARKEKGWTQYELFQKTGLSVGYISNIENGYVNPKRGPVVPSDDSLSSFSEALGIPLSRLHSSLGRDVMARQEIDAIDSITREAGYDTDSLDEAGWARLRQSVDAAVIGVMEQERRKRQK